MIKKIKSAINRLIKALSFGIDLDDITLAAKIGKQNRVQELINEGVDIDKRDNHGYTALMISAFNGTTETVKKLIEAGADVNARSDK